MSTIDSKKGKLVSDPSFEHIRFYENKTAELKKVLSSFLFASSMGFDYSDQVTRGIVPSGWIVTSKHSFGVGENRPKRRCQL